MPPKKKSVKNSIPAEIKNEGQQMINNGLSEAIMGFNPMSTGVQLSQVDTLFKNNRWYLISNMRQLLSEIYAEHGIIQTIVDVPVDDALRGGVEIKTEQLDEKELEKLKVEIEQDDDYNTIALAAKWNRLYGGGGILIMTDQDPAEPLNVEAINEQTPMEFRAVDMWELFWDKQNTESYDRTIQEQKFEYYSYYGIKVHKSRVMVLKGITPPSFIRPRLRGWGLSVVEAFVRSINQYLKANGLTFEVLDEFKLDIFKIEGLSTSLMQPNGANKVRERVALANHQKNFQNALTMDAKDDYVQKQLSFAGISDTMTGIRMQIASDLRMPLTKIFGISAAGFSSGEDDIENYNAMIESHIRGKLKHIILKLIGIKCQKLFGMVPEDLSLEFKPLRMLSAEQQENVKTQQHTRLLSTVQAGMMTVKEFKEACNKNNLLPVTLDVNVDKIETGNEEGTTPGESKNKAPKSKLTPKVAKNEMDMPIIVACGVISGDKILTGLRRDNGLWTNPGGHMNEYETPFEAASRECWEECGIPIQTHQWKIISSERIVSPRTGKPFILHAVIANLEAPIGATSKNDPDNEVSEWKWVKIHQGTPELQGDVRHAANDKILEYLFKGK